ncbi:MAG: biotin synthase BioB [Pseudomonadota bacterium]
MLDAADPAAIRSDWTREEAEALFTLPLIDLLLQAQAVHRAHHAPNAVETAQLLSIKTGGCPEDCGYCNQSAHFDTGLKASKLMEADTVVAAAERAKAGGAARFCMGAAWREPKTRDMPALLDMVARVKALGLETCMTLGMLTDEQSEQLAEAGLDYYNHNIDTSPEYYDKVISTRTFQDRIDTLDRVRKSGMKVCCGGIVGMGEEAEDRIGLLLALANMDPHPESAPINALMPAPGTPLADSNPVDGIEFARLCAVARVLMPRSAVRISAGRENMSLEAQALCFMAGANSIFIGDTLLTAKNPGEDKDAAMFAALGLQPAVSA